MDMGFKYKTINNKRLVLRILHYLQQASNFRAYYQQPRVMSI